MEGKAARLPLAPVTLDNGRVRPEWSRRRKAERGHDSIGVPFLALVLLSNHVVDNDLRPLWIICIIHRGQVLFGLTCAFDCYRLGRHDEHVLRPSDPPSWISVSFV